MSSAYYLYESYCRASRKHAKFHKAHFEQLLPTNENIAGTFVWQCKLIIKDTHTIL